MLNCDRNAEECSVPELVRGNQLFVVRLAMAQLRWLTTTSLPIADSSLLRVTNDGRRAGSHDNVDKRRLHGGRGGGVGVRSAATAIRTRCDATCVMVMRCSIIRCVHTAHCTQGVSHTASGPSSLKGLRPKYTTALLFSASILVFFRPSAAE
jgi:hypothetical protein